MGVWIILHFPRQTVIEGQLLKSNAAQSVDATVANMADISDAGLENEHVAGRPHIVERRVAFASLSDNHVRVEERVAQRVDGGLRGSFEVRLRSLGRGEFTRQLARFVRPHSVGDDEDVTARTPYSSRRRGKSRI